MTKKPDSDIYSYTKMASKIKANLAADARRRKREYV